MDFGIKGKWAIVCAASKGLGYGCARSLAGEGAVRVPPPLTTIYGHIVRHDFGPASRSSKDRFR